MNVSVNFRLLWMMKRMSDTVNWVTGMVSDLTNLTPAILKGSSSD